MVSWPSAAAFSFIIATNASSLPATACASASVASAPEGTTAPYSRSRIVTVSPFTKPAIDAPARYSGSMMACVMVNVASRSGRFSAATSSVMTFVMDAG